MNLPESRHVRRSLVLLAVACILILGVAEVFLMPSTGSQSENVKAAASNLVVNLLTTLLAFLIAGAVAIWLFPPLRDEREVHVVSGRDRTSALESARKATTFWWFSGGLGRFNRTVLVPELAAASRKNNSSRSVVLLTLDPDDDLVCQTYADLRSARRSGKGKDWTLDSVRREILATLIAVHKCQSDEPLLQVEVRLKRFCSLTRLEVCESHAIRTSEDPGESALFFPKTAPYYDLWREDFLLEKKQSRLFDATMWPAQGDEQAIRQWLVAGGIACAGGLSDVQVGELIHLSSNSENPYG